MNLFWVCNTPTEELASHLDNIKVSGSWIDAAIKPLLDKQYHIIYVWANSNARSITKIETNNHQYFLLPSKLSKKQYFECFSELFTKNTVDLVHIWGTEFLHSSICLDVCNHLKIKCVISIQGLINNCSLAYDIKIPCTVKNRFSIIELVRRNTFRKQIKLFEQRGKLEKSTIKKSKFIIGRTSWDKENVIFINNNIRYYHCDENLRSDFYISEKWNINNCEKNTIFISQANYSLKGFHLFLYALKEVQAKVPNIKVYVAGLNITKEKNVKEKLMKTTYAKYITKLIVDFGLKENIIFLGPLNTDEMIKFYLKSNIFCSCSLMENSSNSISEAMILGVPTISSYVGGVPTLAGDKKEILFYSAYDYFHLAALICSLLADEKMEITLSKNSINKAQKRHCIEKNTDDLIAIYNEILLGDEATC